MKVSQVQFSQHQDCVLVFAVVRVVERNGRRPVYEFCLFLHRAALAPVHVLGGGDAKGPNFGPARPFVDLVTDSRETN